MHKRYAFFGYVLLYACLNIPILLWIGEQWFRTSYGRIGALFFAAGCCILVAGKPRLRWKPSVNPSTLLLSFVLLTVSAGWLPVDYSVFRSMCFAFGLLAAAGSFVRLSAKNAAPLCAWLLSCLPILPLIGSTVGLINREIYVGFIHLVFPDAERVGTSLYDGQYAFHIDAGCSGAQGIYVLWGCWSLVALFLREESPRYRAFVEGIALFWLLNGARVAALYILHNKMYISSLDSIDFALGSIGFVIALAFGVIRMKPPSKMPL